VLLRVVNDCQDGCPQDVLRAPEKVLGDQAERLLAFGRHLDRMTADDWRKADAAWAAAGAAARAAARAAAGAAAWAAAGAAAGAAAWDAARDAARAAVVCDLIGQHGFTQEHYDTLTGPWRKVIGPIHPDDEPMDGGQS
jgi:hypothetical protein